jgi:hypothetical protein
VKQKRSEESRAARDLRLEAARVERQQIKERLALPMARRTNFLRVRLPSGGSHL